MLLLLIIVLFLYLINKKNIYLITLITFRTPPQQGAQSVLWDWVRTATKHHRRTGKAAGLIVLARNL